MKIEASPKDKLFQTAARLFYQHGYRAIGVDTIASEAGIGKMTLYRHYPSKDDLIVAYLKQSDEEFWDHFERAPKTRRPPAGNCKRSLKLCRSMPSPPPVMAVRSSMWPPNTLKPIMWDTRRRLSTSRPFGRDSNNWRRKQVRASRKRWLIPCFY